MSDDEYIPSTRMAVDTADPAAVSAVADWIERELPPDNQDDCIFLPTLDAYCDKALTDLMVFHERVVDELRSRGGSWLLWDVASPDAVVHVIGRAA